MKEINLQFYWLNMARGWNNLRTVNGHALDIVYPGEINFNQGPDFLHARIEIDGLLWVGSVEIHINSSDWFHHKHEDDDFYRNVILHVVWKHDVEFFDRCHTLELSGYMHQLPLEYSNPFMMDHTSLGCIPLPPIETLENLALERLERKAHAILLDLKLHEGDWYFVFWKKMMHAFGLPLNGVAFEHIFESVKNILTPPFDMDAYGLKCLLLGQAGMFGSMSNEEVQTFLYLKSIYDIKDCHVLLMKFRMRPTNFPEKRMLECLEMFFQYGDLMHVVVEMDNMENDVFNEIKKEFGIALFDRLCINVFTPFLIAYATFTGKLSFRQKAIEWICSLDPEDNHIIRRYRCNEAGLTALHTQGLLTYANKSSMNITN